MSSPYDVLIVGGGPAGIQIAYLLHKKAPSLNLKYLVLERAANAGAFFDVYPRSDMLISINKVYTGTTDPEFNMRHDWNSLLSDGEAPELFFKHFTEDLFPHRKYLPEYLQAFVKTTGINIQYNTEISSIAKADNLFVLTDTNGNTYKSKNLFMATGALKLYIPDIPGIEKCWTYCNFPSNKEHWLNKRVLILGKGNSAFETADMLAPWASTVHLCSSRPPTLAWDTHYVGNLRAVNTGFLDFYQLKSQHGMVSGHAVDFIWDEGNEGKEVGSGVSVMYDFTLSPDDPVTRFRYDEVIICAGWQYFEPTLFCERTCPVKTIHRGKFSLLTDMWESVSVPNLFWSGTGMQGREFKRFTTGFIHGFRYCVRSQVNMLLNREYGQPYPSSKVARDSEAITKFIVERVNRASGPYQMFEVLVDALVLPQSEEEKELDYIYELPTLFLQGDSKFKQTPYLEIMLQYGDRGGIPAFAFEQQSVPGKAELGWALHPCIRLYYDGKVIARHHMLETAELNWDIPKYHQEPLRAWIDSVLELLRSNPDLGVLPEVKSEAPLGSCTVTYRGGEGEEHMTKNGMLTKDRRSMMMDAGMEGYM